MSSIKLVKQDATHIAIGSSSCAYGGDGALAVGNGACAVGCSGYGASSIAIGYCATSCYGNVAVGSEANATTGNYSVAVGAKSCVAANCGVAIGYEACALACGATAIGYQAKAGIDGANGAAWGTAIGCGAVACGCGLAIGPGAMATAGQVSMSTGGDSCTVSSMQFWGVMGGTTAVELAAAPTDAPITAFCSVTTSDLDFSNPRKTTITPMGITGVNGVTVSSTGQVITITGPGSGLKGATTSTYTTLGEGACVQYEYYKSVAIGYSATTGEDSVAIGYSATAADSQAVAIGYSAVAKGCHGVAIGYCACANRWGIAIGNSASTTTEQGLALGNSASADAENGIAIGGYAAVGVNGVTIGYFSPAPCADSWKDAVTIGYNASGSSNAVTIGYNASGSYGAVTIGYNASGDASAVTIGSNAKGYTSGDGSSIALGYKADPKDANAVAFSNGMENVYMSWDNFKAMLVAAGATVETIT